METLIFFSPSVSKVRLSVTSAPGAPLPLASTSAPSEMEYDTSPVRLSPFIFVVGSLNEMVPFRLPSVKCVVKSVAAVGAPSARASGTVRSIIILLLVNSPTTSAAPVVRSTV